MIKRKRHTTQKRILCILLAFVMTLSYLVPESIRAFAENAAFEATIADFPESYKVHLRKLHEAHPTWQFVAFDTGLDWDEVLYNQMKLSRNVVPNGTMGINGRWFLTPTSWKSTEVDGSYNWAENQWVELVATDWVQASEEAVEYIMDPRNWLTETNVFAFEQLGFNEDYHTYEVLKNMMEDSFMDCDYATVGGSDGKSYGTVLMEAGESMGVSPIHLCARLIQEKGRGSYDSATGQYILTDTLACGQVADDGVTYYNFFNIGAYGNTDEAVLANGLAEAKKEGWDSQYKALVGGAGKVSNNYIKIGQDTVYFQKFSVVNPAYYYWKQYMQNLLAPVNEGFNAKKTYANNGILESPFVFRIPVYNNMPEVCPEPTPTRSTANPNYKLSEITMQGTTIDAQTVALDLTPTFGMDTDNYSVIVPYDVQRINLGAMPIATTSKITGIGEFDLVVGKNVFDIVCTSEYGTSKTYKVTVTRGEGSTYLTALGTSQGDFAEPFDKIQYNYSTAVQADVETIDIQYATESGYAYLELRNEANENIEGVVIEDNTIKNIPLVEGMNNFCIDVYPSETDRTTKKTYNISILKYSATSVDFKELQLNEEKGWLNGFTLGDTVESAIGKMEIMNGTAQIMNAAGETKAPDAVIGTGDVLQIMDNNGFLYAEYSILIYGDVNGDGITDLFDFAYVKKVILENVGLEGIYLEAGDAYVESEGIDLYDFATIKKYILEDVEVPQLR